MNTRNFKLKYNKTRDYFLNTKLFDLKILWKKFFILTKLLSGHTIFTKEEPFLYMKSVCSLINETLQFEDWNRLLRFFSSTRFLCMFSKNHFVSESHAHIKVYEKLAVLTRCWNYSSMNDAFPLSFDPLSN